MNSKHEQQPSQAPNSKPTQNTVDANPDLQGEGNYTASRRYRKSVESFLASGKVNRAANDAAPETEAQRHDMQAAESEGRSHARK